MRLTSRTIEAARIMWERGMGSKQLAEAAGVSHATMWNYIRSHRDQFPHRRHHSDWWRERLESVEGLSGADAARRLGCSEESVSRWRGALHGRK